MCNHKLLRVKVCPLIFHQTKYASSFVFLQGVNVREKAKQLVTLLKDEERLREERIHALKTKEKMAQTSSGRTWSHCFLTDQFEVSVILLHIYIHFSFLGFLSTQPRWQPVSRLALWRRRPWPGLATELRRGRPATPASPGHEQRGSGAGSAEQPTRQCDLTAVQSEEQVWAFCNVLLLLCTQTDVRHYFTEHTCCSFLTL